MHKRNLNIVVSCETIKKYLVVKDDIQKKEIQNRVWIVAKEMRINIGFLAQVELRKKHMGKIRKEKEHRRDMKNIELYLGL